MNGERTVTLSKSQHEAWQKLKDTLELPAGAHGDSQLMAALLEGGEIFADVISRGRGLREFDTAKYRSTAWASVPELFRQLRERLKARRGPMLALPAPERPRLELVFADGREVGRKSA